MAYVTFLEGTVQLLAFAVLVLYGLWCNYLLLLF